MTTEIIIFWLGAILFETWGFACYAAVKEGLPKGER